MIIHRIAKIMSTENSQTSPEDISTELIKKLSHTMTKNIKMRSQLLLISINENKTPIPELLTEIKTTVLRYKLDICITTSEILELTNVLLTNPSRTSESLKESLKVFNNVSGTEDVIGTSIAKIFSGKNTDEEKFEAIQCLLMAA